MCLIKTSARPYTNCDLHVINFAHRLDSALSVSFQSRHQVKILHRSTLPASSIGVRAKWPQSALCQHAVMLVAVDTLAHFVPCGVGIRAKCAPTTRDCDRQTCAIYRRKIGPRDKPLCRLIRFIIHSQTANFQFGLFGSVSNCWFVFAFIARGSITKLVSECFLFPYQFTFY